MKAHHHHIFWADDDVDDRTLFREVLEAHAPNHEVREFTNGQELIEALRNTHPSLYPCLIVLDMNMPVFGGKETLELLKSDPAFQHLPVVMFTTSSSLADRQFCAQYQTEMITKPPSFDHLKGVVARFVDLCSVGRKKEAA